MPCPLSLYASETTGFVAELKQRYSKQYIEMFRPTQSLYVQQTLEQNTHQTSMPDRGTIVVQNGMQIFVFNTKCLSVNFTKPYVNIF